MENQKRKIEWISMAKGFGILGIVALHTSHQFDVKYLSDVASLGMFCVQLFFVISAFLTFKSLERVTEPWTAKNYLQYIGHKLLRFIPVLYTAVLWHFIMHCIEIGGFPGIHDEIWKNIFFAITLLNGFSYHYINPWMNWYVGTLVIFIAIAPILFKFINNSKKAVLFFLGSFIFDVLSIYILEKFGVDTGWYFYCWLPRQLPVMAFGIIFYHFSKNGISEDNRNSLMAFIFLIVLIFLFTKKFKPNLEEHIQYGLLFFAFTYILFSYCGKYFRWLNIFGDESYGIYLYHGCLLPIVSSLIRKIGISINIVNFVLCFVFLLISSLLISKIINAFLGKKVSKK